MFVLTADASYYVMCLVGCGLLAGGEGDRVEVRLQNSWFVCSALARDILNSVLHCFSAVAPETKLHWYGDSGRSRSWWGQDLGASPQQGCWGRGKASQKLKY